jgi:hypothetical protein
MCVHVHRIRLVALNIRCVVKEVKKNHASFCANMIKHDLTGVRNQYKMSGGRRACVAISILTLFHLYRRACPRSGFTNNDNTEFIMPTKDEWEVLLERGVALYGRWRARLASHNAEKFPTR